MRHGMVRNTKKENTYEIVSSKGVELGFKGVSWVWFWFINIWQNKGTVPMQDIKAISIRRYFDMLW